MAQNFSLGLTNFFILVYFSKNWDQKNCESPYFKVTDGFFLRKSEFCAEVGAKGIQGIDLISFEGVR